MKTDREKARIILSQLEVKPKYTKIVIGNDIPYGSGGFFAKTSRMIVDVMAGRKFYETKKQRNVYDWTILVIRILNITKNENLQKSIENKIKRIFGYDIKIKPSDYETILLRNQMIDVTENRINAVTTIIKILLDKKNIGYSVFENTGL